MNNAQSWSWGNRKDVKKILVLNGSPRRGASCTLRVTDAFLAGVTSFAPCDVEMIHVSDLHIKPCFGCLSCWGRTEGTCVISDDDIPALKQKILDADVIIESYPLYFFGMPGTVKVMTDRLLSMLSTYKGQKPTEGESFHGIRYDMSGKRFLLISTCGYAQTDLIYDALLREYDCICGAGHYLALLCPEGKVFSAPELRDRTDRYLEKYTAAGREFAESGTLAAETLANLSVPAFDDRRFRLLLNKFWSDEAQNQVHKEGQDPCTK